MPKYSIVDAKLKEAALRASRQTRQALEEAYLSRNQDHSQRPNPNEYSKGPKITDVNEKDILKIFKVQSTVKKHVVVVDATANDVLPELQQFCRLHCKFLFTKKFDVNWACCEGPKRIVPVKGYEINITDTRGAFAQVKVNNVWHEIVLASSYSSPGGVLWSATAPISELIKLAQQLEFELKMELE